MARQAAGWMINGQVELWGAEAIAAALRARGPVSRVFGTLLDLPMVRTLARTVYQWVADNRQRMPGGSAACALTGHGDEPNTGRVSALPLLSFGLVALLFFAAYPVLAVTGREPYPAIQMPTFAGDPEFDGVVESSEVRLTVQYSDGSAERIDGQGLLPYNWVSPLNAVRLTFASSQTANQPETAQWLRRQVLIHNPGSDPAALHVRWVVTRFDVATKHKSDGRIMEAFSVALEPAG